jgi:AcrR family transcriptional regulator
METIFVSIVSIVLCSINQEVNPDTRILDGAHELFLRFGMKSVSMDDIAKHLGVSKKTIYIAFEDKNQLVEAIAHKEMKDTATMISQIASVSKNAIEEIIHTMQYMGKTFSRMNPNMIYDMQKYHPKAWSIFKNFKEHFIMQIIVKNLEKGKAEGYYRKDLNNKILARLRLEEVEMAMNPSIFPPDQFNIVELHVQMIDHFMHGICTLKGHKLINKYRQIEED